MRIKGVKFSLTSEALVCGAIWTQQLASISQNTLFVNNHRVFLANIGKACPLGGGKSGNL